MRKPLTANALGWLGSAVARSRDSRRPDPDNGAAYRCQVPVPGTDSGLRCQVPVPGTDSARGVWRYADHQLAEVLALQQADESRRRVVDAVDDVLAELDPARQHQRRDLLQ